MNLIQIASTDADVVNDANKVMKQVPRTLLEVTDFKALFYNDPKDGTWLHIGGDYKQDKLEFEDNFTITENEKKIVDDMKVYDNDIRLSDKIHINKEVDVGYDTDGNRLADDDTFTDSVDSVLDSATTTWEFQNGPDGDEVTTTLRQAYANTTGLGSSTQQTLNLNNNGNEQVQGYFQQAVSSLLYAVNNGGTSNSANRVSGNYYYIRQGSNIHWVIGIDDDSLHLKFSAYSASGNRTLRIYKAGSNNGTLVSSGDILWSASLTTTEQVYEVDLDKGDYVITATGSAYYQYFEIMTTTVSGESTVEGWTNGSVNTGYSFGDGLTLTSSNTVKWSSNQKATNLGYLENDSDDSSMLSLAMAKSGTVTVGFSTTGSSSTVTISDGTNSASATSTSSASITTAILKVESSGTVTVSNTGGVYILYMTVAYDPTVGSDSEVTLADDTVGNIKALNRVDAKYFKSTNGLYTYTHTEDRTPAKLPDWNEGALSVQGNPLSYSNDPAAFLHIPHKWYSLMSVARDNYICLLFPKTDIKTTDTFDDDGNKTGWGTMANVGGSLIFKSQTNGRIGHYDFSFSSTGSRSLKGSININKDLGFSLIKFPDNTYWYAIHFPTEMVPWDLEFNGYSDIPAELVANIDTYYNYITDDAYKEQMIIYPLTPDSSAGSEELYVTLNESNYTSILEYIDKSVDGLGDDAEPHTLTIDGTLTKPMIRAIAEILKLYPERQFILDMSDAVVDTSSDSDKNAQVWDEEFFSKCTSLREFYLPQGVTSIKANVWTWCTYLRKLDLSASEGTLTSWGMSTWQTKVGPLTSTRVKVIVFPASCYQIGAYTIAYSNLKLVFFKNTSTVFTGIDNSWSSFTLDGLDSGGSDLGETDGVECRLYISPKVWGDTMNCQGTILTAQQISGVPALTDDQVVELYGDTLYAEDGDDASEIRQWFADNVTTLYNAQSTKATSVNVGWGTGWCSAMTHAGNWCGSGIFSSSALNCMCKYFLIYDPDTFNFNRIDYDKGIIGPKEE